MYKLVLIICFSPSICFSLSSVKSFRNNRLFQLSGTVTTPTGDNLEPAYYERDLYRVLGVAKNATRTELRDAYWVIASQNHPDRNKTQRALEIFRNSSYAYKVLGKDPQTRKEYDESMQTKEFVDIMREVGNEIVVPLTMDVAVPLLNMTFNVIGSVAVPFFRNVFEQSSAIIAAATQETDVNNNDNNMDYLSKTAQNVAFASSFIRSKQKVRAVKEKLDKVNNELTNTIYELEEAKQKETDAITRKVMLTNISLTLEMRAKETSR